MLLEICNIATSYGLSQVLFDVSFAIDDGEVVTLMGRNGMGKTTTVRSLMGLIKPHGGEIRFRGERIDQLPPHRIARLGLGLVPEGRQIFPNLTVRENLLMAEQRKKSDRPWTIGRVFDLFPILC
jgi:branched-chain amino acid transport system ATP-binding protein